jgi:anti-sigma factor RsiW
MSEHWNEEAVARYADGEEHNDAHLRECTPCANAVIAALQMKRAVREAVPRYELPASLRDRVMGRRPAPRRRSYTGWMAVAAAALLLVIAGDVLVLASRRASATRELVDLHTTIVGSANPIDVVSTDKHTVKPWFEGKVPFAVNVPELAGTPFHLAGGRLVYWHGRPGAYMLVTKGAHRVSLFAFPSDVLPQLDEDGAMTIVSWRAGGLTYVAIGDLPRAELETLGKGTT